MLQIIHHDIGPSRSKHIEHVATIDLLVNDHYQSPGDYRSWSLQSSPCAIVSSVARSGLGHHAVHAAAAEQRQASLPATVTEMMARLSLMVACDHSRMPNQQPHFITRRNQPSSP
jgi:hypothetical protein